MSNVTGFTPDQVAGILMREGGICSMYGANPGCLRRATTANHRLNRGAGGTSDRGAGRNGTDNGCAICDVCNDAIETDPKIAELARQRGVKLRDGDNPRTVALWCVFFGLWVQLAGDAMYLTASSDIATRPELTDPEQLDVSL